MKVVHMQTQISTTFGLLTDDGNRQDPQPPIQATVSEFSEKAFVEAYRQIAAEDARRRALLPAEPELDGAEAPKRRERPKK